MKFGLGALVSGLTGAVLGVVSIVALSFALAMNTIPETEQPAADQALLGQVDYGQR